MTGEWITRLAEDERKRDDVRLRAMEAVTRKADLVRVHGQRLLDELRTAVVRGCAYRFTPTNGLPPREDRLEFMLTSDGGDDRLQITHDGTGQVFTNADALSEYLLVPALTGRPR